MKKENYKEDFPTLGKLNKDAAAAQSVSLAQRQAQITNKQMKQKDKQKQMRGEAGMGGKYDLNFPPPPA